MTHPLDRCIGGIVMRLIQHLGVGEGLEPEEALIGNVVEQFDARSFRGPIVVAWQETGTAYDDDWMKR